jgi:hypothetical protein
MNIKWDSTVKDHRRLLSMGGSGVQGQPRLASKNLSTKQKMQQITYLKMY